MTAGEDGEWGQQEQGRHPFRRQAVLANAQENADDGDHDKGGHEQTGEPGGVAQDPGDPLGTGLVLHGGVGQHDEPDAGRHHQLGRRARVPERFQPREGQGGVEARDEQGQQRKDPGQEA